HDVIAGLGRTIHHPPRARRSLKSGMGSARPTYLPGVLAVAWLTARSTTRSGSRWRSYAPTSGSMPTCSPPPCGRGRPVICRGTWFHGGSFVDCPSRARDVTDRVGSLLGGGRRLGRAPVARDGGGPGAPKPPLPVAGARGLHVPRSPAPVAEDGSRR